MRDFLRLQLDVCRTALEAINSYGDRNSMTAWFEGRRDMCLIALQELDRLEEK